MKTVKIADAGNNLSKYLAYVRKGGRVRILDRQTPVAEIVPIAPISPERAELEALEREGIVRVGRPDPLPEDFFKPGPPDPDGRLLSALLDERRSGR